MKKVVTFGEIMLHLAPREYLRFSQASSFDVVYGGGNPNVAVSLSNSGVPVISVTRLPKNDIGKCARMEMKKLGSWCSSYYIRWRPLKNLFPGNQCSLQW